MSFEFPDSVEEAAALLGACITKVGVAQSANAIQAPPKGMHSAFATIHPIPSSELITRLYSLRSLLKASEAPLLAAPSILAVLMKLPGLSVSLANNVAANATSTALDDNTPPMVSNPIRKLWADSVVLCHVKAQGLSGTARIDTTQFLRRMLDVAMLHPRSQKAQGGVRIAALDVIARLLPALPQQLAPWALDVLQVVLKCLKFAGMNEPTFRVKAMVVASATCDACRQSHLLTKDNVKYLMVGAIEDKALAEVVKVLKQAASDKFPEVRCKAAECACILAPMLIASRQAAANNTDPLVNLEEVLLLGWKKLDDESPATVHGWSQAVARCTAAALDHYKATPPVPRQNNEFLLRKPFVLLTACSSLKSLLQYLVDQFNKVGGELTAVRLGGSHSTGGRGVRVGIALTLIDVLRLQFSFGNIASLDASLSLNDIVKVVLSLLGDEMDKQVRAASSAPSASSPTEAPSTGVFGSGLVTKPSRSDAGIVRVLVTRVFRQGLSRCWNESMQIQLLNELVQHLPSSISASSIINANQLQVILIELSHLVASLGEALLAQIDDIIVKLKVCLDHSDHGVRHEACVACLAITTCFSHCGRSLLDWCCDDLKIQYAELMTMTSASSEKSKSSSSVASESISSGLRMFRRTAASSSASSVKDSTKIDMSGPHQAAIHGRCLMISMLIQKLPQLSDGLSSASMDKILPLIEVLLSCQFRNDFAKENPAAVCVCVRGGFTIVSGILAMGPESVVPHVATIFSAWQKCFDYIKKADDKSLSARHDLFCMDSALVSVVVFLRYCSELLLTVPEALTQVTVLLEGALPLLVSAGRLGSLPTTPSIAARLESCRASVLEAFAWLPSGSFPMIADEVFSFAAQQIQVAVENEVTCSVLGKLVTREDSLLDTKTFERASMEGQVGGAEELEETLVTLTAEVCYHGERESVLHLHSEYSLAMMNSITPFRNSRILGTYSNESLEPVAPTPLHEVGTWRRPVIPSYSSRVRLSDAAVQAFAATFGLKSGKEQQKAMDMLEALIPPFLAQLAKAIGVNTSMSDQDRRVKLKEDNAAVANITAVLLSCLQSLPLHEATHNVPIGLGPPWMNKAKDLLLTLLPSASNIVRRAAAEGLALLATLGVTEDAHFLQSTVLHSLDEVMQGNKPDGKPRSMALEPISAARAGSLLTLACIQRTSHRVSLKQLARARGRVTKSSASKLSSKNDQDLPLLQMLTRILPSTACHGFKDYFVVRTYAIHSFSVLLGYSGRLNNVDSLDEEARQLLRKGVEMVESNFVVAWTAASADIDKGQEAERMAYEAAFLAVLLRLMLLLTPYLRFLRCDDFDICRRFILLATFILEECGDHPAVATEAMAFFEVASHHQRLLPPMKSISLYSENSVFVVVPFILRSLQPMKTVKHVTLDTTNSLSYSPTHLRSVTCALQALIRTRVPISTLCGTKVLGHLIASLDSVCGGSLFPHANSFRSLATPRDTEEMLSQCEYLERELCSLMTDIVYLEDITTTNEGYQMLHLILFSKEVLSGTPSTYEEPESDTTAPKSIDDVIAAVKHDVARDAKVVWDMKNTLRWQVKAAILKVMYGSVDRLHSCSLGTIQETHFVYEKAKSHVMQAIKSARGSQPHRIASRLAFHLQDIVSTACMYSSATIEQSELTIVQGNAMSLLDLLIRSFADSEDPDIAGVSILDQYAQQIFSAIKHGLECEYRSYPHLVLITRSCHAFESLIKKNLTKDPAVIRRLARSLVPSKDELSKQAELLEYWEKNEKHQQVDMTDIGISMPVLAVKSTAFGAVFFDSKTTEAIDSVGTELIPDNLHVAVCCAAVAVDGCRLLHSHNLSLIGRPSGSSTHSTVDDQSGILFKSFSGMENACKTVLASSWSRSACSSILPMLNALGKDDDSNRSASVLQWLEVTFNLLSLGISDAFQVNDEVSNTADYEWTNGLERDTVIIDCLSGITCIAQHTATKDLISQDSARLDTTIRMLNDHILECSYSDQQDYVVSTKIVDAVCQFLQNLSSSSSDILSESVINLLTVSSLKVLQRVEGKVDEVKYDLRFDKIIVCCMDVISHLIKNGKGVQTLPIAMLSFVTELVTKPRTKEEPLSKEMNDSMTRMLMACIHSDNIPQVQLQSVSKKIVNAKNWAAWAAILASGKGIDNTLQLADKMLLSSECDVVDHASIASAVRLAIQTHKDSDVVVMAILRNLGTNLLGLLLLYGTQRAPPTSREHFQPICTDVMATVLVGYRHLASNQPEPVVEAFVTSLFMVMLEVLRFNGLPGHAQPNGNVTLGRLCAQASLLVARTTPGPFKSCLSQLSAPDRGLLEFAVRGEMTGYAGATQQGGESGGPKKVLSLKGFKK